jgi:serine/threonine-protein kinase PknG
MTVRSNVTARPSTIATVSGLNTGTVAKRRRNDVSVRSSTKSRRGIAAGLVEMEPQAPIDMTALIKADLIVPESQRVCYNPNCKTYINSGRTQRQNLARKGADGRLIDKGICPKCGTRFNFEPLAENTLVGGQYSVYGAIACGGFGLIYLAYDTFVGRTVVLKGLLNSMDPEQMASAVQERKFLADLSDPGVVGIYNFVTHQVDEGDLRSFIVMEFIDGKTLKAVKKEWMAEHDDEPLPVTQAIYYVLGALPGMGYFHKRKVAYCDGKMENVMVQGDRVRWIDVGACIDLKQTSEPPAYSHGYAAFEACNDNPVASFASDLYSLGRILAVLCMNFEWTGTYDDNDNWVSGKYEFSLPTPDEQPLFRKYESFYRFLLRACHEDPDQRFQTADEMGDQLLGVLSEIVSIDAEESNHRNVVSTEFVPDVLKNSDAPTYQSVPELKTDLFDPAAGQVEAALALTDREEQMKLLRQAVEQFSPAGGASKGAGHHSGKAGLVLEVTSGTLRPGDLVASDSGEELGAVGEIWDSRGQSVPAATNMTVTVTGLNEAISFRSFKVTKLSRSSAEAFLRLAWALTEEAATTSDRTAAQQAFQEADRLLAFRIERDPFDWRNIWVKGRLLLAQGQVKEAREHFDAVYSEVPGEIAPKLALALAAELHQDADTAIRYYELVSGIDRTFVTATFGLARCLKTRDVKAAAEAYERVLPQSISFVPALMLKVRTILSDTPDADSFNHASDTLKRISGDNLQMSELRADFFTAAIAAVERGVLTTEKGAAATILGVNLNGKALRFAAEKELLLCADYVRTDKKKFLAFVDRANEIRPWTTV